MADDSPAGLIGWFIVLLFAVLIAAVLAYVRDERRFLTSARARLRAALDGTLEDGEVVATHAGTPFRGRFVRGAGDRPVRLMIIVPGTSAVPFDITRPLPLGEASAFTTGDAAFDRDFVISESSADVARFVGTPERRQAVRDLFQLGVIGISREGAAVSTAFNLRTDRPDHPRVDTVRTVVERLRFLGG